MGEKIGEKNSPAAAMFYAYYGDATVPEIPYVQDVLYVFRLSDKEARYEFGLEHHPPYISNVLMTAARVADRLFRLDERDDAARKKLIAETVIELCPEEARCLFNPAYAEALRMSGQYVPTVLTEQTGPQCGCCRCRIRRAQEDRFHACDG